MSHNVLMLFVSIFIFTFILASICFVVLQIVSIAVQYEQGHMHYLFPEQAEY